MKRTERHHLKEDEMARGAHWLVEFFENYKREIGIVGAAVAFAIVVFGALMILRSHARNVQSAAIGQVTTLAGEIDQNPAKLADLEKLTAERRTARLANLELGRYWAEKSDWAKADSYLAKVPASPKDLLYYQVEDLKAQVALARKDADTAVAIYKKIVEEKPKSYPLDAALFGLAKSQEAKGDTAAAVETYKKLQADFPQTYYGYEASLRAGKLDIRK